MRSKTLQTLVLTALFGLGAGAESEAVDFGDYTSETLTTKAWLALIAEEPDLALVYTAKCIELYAKEALKMQASLTAYAPKDNVFNYWALNDVGTCYFITGEALLQKKQWAEAHAAYETCIRDFSYSQCWDPKGWFWKPAVGARGKANKIRAEYPEAVQS